MDTISMTPDEIIIKLNKEIDNIQDLWKAERGTVLDELSFLAADIQSCQNEDDISYTFQTIEEYS